MRRRVCDVTHTSQITHVNVLRRFKKFKRQTSGWPVCLVYWLVLCKALDYLPLGSDFVPAPAEEAALTKEIPWKYTACLPAWMCTLKIYLERETSTFISQELFSNTLYLEFEGTYFAVQCLCMYRSSSCVWNFPNSGQNLQLTQLNVTEVVFDWCFCINAKWQLENDPLAHC